MQSEKRGGFPLLAGLALAQRVAGMTKAVLGFGLRPLVADKLG